MERADLERSRKGKTLGDNGMRKGSVCFFSFPGNFGLVEACCEMKSQMSQPWFPQHLFSKYDTKHSVSDKLLLAVGRKS